MKKNKLIILISALIFAQSSFAATYENLVPAQYAGRIGVGGKVESKTKIVVKKTENKKNQEISKDEREKTTTSKTVEKSLTYADLSLKQISKDVIDEMDIEQEEILSDLSTLYNSALQRSETIQYAIYKLSNPNGEKPNESAVKKVLKPIASFSTIAGTALSANPYMASGALIGGGLVNAFSSGDKEANYKFTKVNDADMVLLVKKIDKLQKDLLNNYINYRTQKDLLNLSLQNLENRQKMYELLQNKKASREQLMMADTFLREAQNNVKKAQADYNLSRVILENLAGKEALSDIEKKD